MGWGVVVDYVVQGRRTDRDAEGRAREVVRLDRARSATIALAIAEAMLADDLTVWVFETRARIGSAPSYRLVRVVGR